MFKLVLPVAALLVVAVLAFAMSGKIVTQSNADELRARYDLISDEEICAILDPNRIPGDPPAEAGLFASYYGADISQSILNARDQFGPNISGIIWFETGILDASCDPSQQSTVRLSVEIAVGDDACINGFCPTDFLALRTSIYSDYPSAFDTGNGEAIPRSVEVTGNIYERFSLGRTMMRVRGCQDIDSLTAEQLLENRAPAFTDNDGARTIACFVPCLDERTCIGRNQ